MNSISNSIPSSEIIAQINLTISDLEDVFTKLDIPKTQENIKRFVDDTYTLKALKDVSFQYGLEILAELVSTMHLEGRF